MINYGLYFWVYTTAVVVAMHPKVKIDTGVLEGQYVNGLTRKFASFTKIPYAEPPLNQLRFAVPRPVLPWKGILNAKLEPPICPQMLPYKNSPPIGEEDCLYLNVYTPKVERNDTNYIPVMIFFHGGSFSFGSGTLLKPHALLEADIVLVTVNYRLDTVLNCPDALDGSGALQQLDHKIIRYRKLFYSIAASVSELSVPHMNALGGLGMPSLYSFNTNKLINRLATEPFASKFTTKPSPYCVHTSRCSALGFLSTGDEASPGNYGLKDQNLSIQWVKRHIRHFGGNPNKITIFGESAGGASAHYHMLSPLSKDLINGVISQSGLANARWTFETRDEGQCLSKKLAKLLNCSTDYSHGMVDCLRKVSSRDIVLIQVKLPLPNTSKHMPIFKPVIETDVKGAFLTQPPLEIIRGGDFAKVPFLVGITANDGCVCTVDHCEDRTAIAEFNRHFEEIIANEMGIDHRMDKNYTAQEIKRFYFKNQLITCNDKGRENISNMYTDALFLAPTNEVLELYLKYNHTSLYNYDFEYKSSTLPSTSAIIGDALRDYGICHSDDMNFLSGDPNSLKYYSSKDRAVVDRMVNMWTNFAIYGNPTPFDGAWKTVKTNDLEYYAIKGPQGGKMSKNLYSDRANFWRNLQL